MALVLTGCSVTDWQRIEDAKQDKARLFEDARLLNSQAFTDAISAAQAST